MTVKTTRHHAFRKPTTKELDLLLLAGCSCLMTLLYHPVANALQTPTATGEAPAAPISRTVTQSTGLFCPAMPPQREKLRIEQE